MLNDRAIKRINKELEKILKEPPSNCSANIIDPDNIAEWQGMILGPKDTPYENGMFKLKINFPSLYPMKPPQVKFITKIYHPNIDEDGNICLDILRKEWAPSLTITKVLLSICSLLADPNPDDPLFPNAANQYQNDINAFNITARQYTESYAS
jgi:ubiquitin-conjugating enzyme E2 D